MFYDKIIAVNKEQEAGLRRRTFFVKLAFNVAVGLLTRSLDSGPAIRLTLKTEGNEYEYV